MHLYGWGERVNKLKAYEKILRKRQKNKKFLYLVSRERKGGYNMEKPRLIPADYLRDNPFAE